MCRSRTAHAQIANSALIQALVSELEPDNTASQGDCDRLNLSMAPFLEKNMESLIEGVDDLLNEQGKVRMNLCLILLGIRPAQRAGQGAHAVV